ncbi:hypothetical protein ACFQX6_57190 [Streptosporangium lutulentum]
MWSRTASSMPMAARGRFRQAVEDMTESWLWELANHIQNRIPDPIDYIEMRRKTFGSDLTMSLSRLAHDETVPPEIYRTSTMRGLDNSAADYACLTNDIFSYQKEIQFEGELHNCVLVVQNFLNCDLRQAVDIVNDLMTSRIRQFQHIVDTELPVLFTNFDLDESAQEVLNGYVGELQDWMAAFCCGTGRARYDESELSYPPTTARPVNGPTGLGTAAAHLGSFLRAGAPAPGAEAPVTRGATAPAI